MHQEEEKRLNAKHAVWICPWDSVNKTNYPSHTVSPLFETYKEAQDYLVENFPSAGAYDYGVFRTGEDGRGYF